MWPRSCFQIAELLLALQSCEDKMALWRPDPYREMKCGTLHNSLTHIRDYQMRDNTIWFVKFALDSEFQVKKLNYCKKKKKTPSQSWVFLANGLWQYEWSHICMGYAQRFFTLCKVS